MEQVSIGKITNTVGLHGEVKVFVTTDFPSKRFQKGQLVTLLNEEANERFETVIASARQSNERYVVSFKNITSIKEAEKLIGLLVLIEKKVENLPKGFYYHADLIGCGVYDDGKNLIGTVAKVEDYPAHRTLRITRNDGPDVLIPFIAAFIKSVNIEKKEIVARIIEGML
ncbi:MAG: ribosome maturation factor RimM [Bacilli bacterium]